MEGFVHLNSEQQFNEIIEASKQGKGVLIYKHSTRCFISSMALRRLSGLNTESFTAYYLDLLEHRSVSNAVAQEFGVVHQSPQLLWIVDGKCIASTSHEGVGVEIVESWLKNA